MDIEWIKEYEEEEEEVEEEEKNVPFEQPGE